MLQRGWPTASTKTWCEKLANQKLISFKCPEAYLEGLNELVRAGIYPSRSEAIRVAIRDLLRRELWEVDARRGEAKVPKIPNQYLYHDSQPQVKPIEQIVGTKEPTNGFFHLLTSSLLDAIFSFREILRDVLELDSPDQELRVSEPRKK